MHDDDGIPIKLITSTFVSEPTEIDPEKLQEALKMLGEAVQKRINSEITRGLTSPSVSRPAIKIDNDSALFDQRDSVFWNIFATRRHYQGNASYALPSAYSSSPVMKARIRTTKRKDGREQKTCECGCCAYPHRAGSVEGCKS